MSISKAQAEALADGFLDSIGSDRDGVFPRQAMSEIFLLAGELIEDAQNNLNQSNNNSSGALSASLVASDPRSMGNVMSVDIFMNLYGRFVNKGVKGTKGGSSTAGYSFKYDMPGVKMLEAIAEWTKRGKVTTSTVKKYRGYGAHERKQKALSQLTAADAVFGLARSIKMKGIKPTGFLDKAVQKTTNKVSDRLGAALRIDVINSLNDT